MAFVSYAQNFEDVILWRCFGALDNGFYVDVGAYDPQEHSVTKAFYDRGWHGVNIEPIGTLFRRLEQARPRDINLQIAAGNTNSTIKMYEIANTGLSTTEEDIAATHQQVGHQVSEVRVEVQTLADIFKSHAPQEVHFLKIDVEGGARAVIEGLDFSVNRPWVIVVEATLPMSQEPDFNAWDRLILDGGYDFVYFDGLNRFYLAKEHAELAPCFKTPPNVFDEFESSDNHTAKLMLSQVEREIDPESSSFKKALAKQRQLSPAEREQAARIAVYGDRLQRHVAERAAQHQEDQEKIADLSEQLDFHMTRTRDLEVRLSRETAFGETVLSRLGQREGMLEAVYASTSWRITAPVRSVRRWLTRKTDKPEPIAAVTPAPAPALEPAPERPTIFVECTHTYHSDLNTGIQRVVRNVLRNAPSIAAQHDYDIVPVILEGNEFRCVEAERVLADKMHEVREDPAATAPAPPLPRSWKGHTRAFLGPVWRIFIRTATVAIPSESVRRFLYAPPTQPGLARHIVALAHFLQGRHKPQPASARRPDSLDGFARYDGSILLLLDSSWASPIWPATQRFKQRGGTVVGVIYDLIPITHVHTCVPELTLAFGDWLAGHFRVTDAFVCISKSVADSLSSYIRKESRGRTLLSKARIGYFHLGSELDFIDPTKPVRQSIKDIFDEERHSFLMVGSIEPRKMHSYVLDAFDRFWARGGTGALIIVGRHGWKTEDFLERVAMHPQLGKQLFIFRDTSDSELDYGYRNASSLVIASEIEGFGLPVVEAFQRGLPVLCSDIPVFREIADSKATFFDLSSPANLTDALEDFCAKVDLKVRRQREPQSWISWRQSTEQLLAEVVDVHDKNVAA
ncbi:FkbM family methyltransferase [Rhizobium rhizogenes]|uniref:FkbM family methyltransferase n=1 Tax=Rhizobium rhizogenes TaxID=359 RepID=UPI003ECCD741